MVSNPEFELTAEISNIFQTYVRIRLRAQLEHVQNIFSNKNKTFTSRLRKIVGRRNSNRSRNIFYGYMRIFPKKYRF